MWNLKCQMWNLKWQISKRDTRNIIYCLFFGIPAGKFRCIPDGWPGGKVSYLRVRYIQCFFIDFSICVKKSSQKFRAFPRFLTSIRLNKLYFTLNIGAAGEILSIFGQNNRISFTFFSSKRKNTSKISDIFYVQLPTKFYVRKMLKSLGKIFTCIRKIDLCT